MKPGPLKALKVGMGSYHPPIYKPTLPINRHNHRLQDCLDPLEKCDFHLVWRPPPAAALAAKLAAAEVEAASDSAGSFPLCSCLGKPLVVDHGDYGGGPDHDPDQVEAEAVICSRGSSHMSKVGGLEEAAEVGVDGDQQGWRLRAQAAWEGGWGAFDANLMAYMYMSLYHKAVPAEARVPHQLLRKLQPLLAPELRALGAKVTHTFKPVEAPRVRGRR